MATIFETAGTAVSREERRDWNQKKCFAALASVWRWDEMTRWNFHISSDTSEWRLPTKEVWEYHFPMRSKWMRRRAVELMIETDISKLSDQWESLLSVMPSGVRRDLTNMTLDFADWMSVKMSTEDMNRRNQIGSRIAREGTCLVPAEKEDTFSMVDVNERDQDFEITPLEDWSSDSDSDNEALTEEVKKRIERNDGLPLEMKRYRELSDEEVYDLGLMQEVTRWKASRRSSDDPRRSCLSRWEGTREAREKNFFAKEVTRKKRLQEARRSLRNYQYRKAYPVTRRQRKRGNNSSKQS